MMKGFPDIKLRFGTAELKDGSGAFSDVIDVGKAQPGRTTVRIMCTEAGAGGTSVAFKLQGSDDKSNWSDLEPSYGAIPLAKITLGREAAIVVPEDFDKKYLRLYATATGTFTAGKFEAWIDTYMGI